MAGPLDNQVFDEDGCILCKVLLESSEGVQFLIENGSPISNCGFILF